MISLSLLLLLSPQLATPQPSGQIRDTLPSAWPIALPTPARLAAARNCDPGIAPGAPQPADTSANCLLARALVAETRTLARGAAPADSTRHKLVSLFKTEPLLLLSNALFYNPLFGRAVLVQPPPIALQPIASIAIQYTWNGLGTAVAWNATVAASNDSALVTLTQAGAADVVTRIPANLLQEIGPAMTNFVPIAANPKIQPCFDNVPDWKVVLTFSDGKAVSLATHSSNSFNLGGPWQMELDGQKYLQLSGALVVAMGKLSSAAKVQYGRPAAMSCRPSGSVLGESFPPG